MRFDDFFIEQVKNSVNIVDVVQNYVKLVKKGQNYQALCPFHSEKTPSFSVSASKQIFKCFGCGAAGDVIAFISRIESLSFPEAVRLLAERNGIQVPEPSVGKGKQSWNRKRLLEILSAASNYCRQQLSAAPDALDFLEDAGLSDRTRHRFGLGYTSGSSGMAEHLATLSFSREEIEICGLDRIPPEHAENSIVLPLTDITGRVLSFAFLPLASGSREILHSFDSPVFQGKRSFFGLHLARQAMKEKDYVILTGRSIDGMLLSQSGIPNVVVCLGGGLTEQQARTLGRNTKKVIINHARSARQGAALLRSVEYLLKEGFSINVAEIPEEKGLALLLREDGLEGYTGRLKGSTPLFDYLLDLHLLDAGGSGPGDESGDILARVKYLLSKVPSRIARSEYVARAAAKLGISPQALEKGLSGNPLPGAREYQPQPVADADQESITRTVERDSFLEFTPELREEIRDSSPIAETIEVYQKLDPRDHIYRGRCPFHPDPSLSLRVNPERQIFKCLGCGAGGEIFSYISRFEELSFPEAILDLAVQGKITLPDLPGKLFEASNSRLRLLGLMEKASSFFTARLGDSPQALEYLESRGISSESRDIFAFGYAPPGNKLLSAMRAEGYTATEIEEAGLAVRKDSGDLYDKFRNRMIVAIKDLRGRVIAFGGRSMGDAIPKYLNSPETILYNKRKQLFGLNAAKDEIARKDFAILVEGYFDCIIPSQHGIRNIVASLGTSLTEQQVSLLGGFTRNVVVCFDPDSAGQEAAARSINMFLSQGFKVRVAQLPEGKDPDQVINETGVASYNEIIDQAVPFIDFMVRKHQSASPSAMSPQGKQKIVSELIPSLLMVPNSVERSQMAARAATLLKLDEKLVLEEIRRHPRPRHFTGRDSSANPVYEALTLSERILLFALLDRDRFLPELDKLESSLFEGSRIKSLYETILGLRKKGLAPSVTRVWDVLDDIERDLLEYWSISEEAIKLDEENLESTLANLKRQGIRLQIKEIQDEIARVEKDSGDSGKIRDLLREKERLSRRVFL